MRNNMLMNTKRGWAYRKVFVLRTAKHEEPEGSNYCI